MGGGHDHDHGHDHGHSHGPKKDDKGKKGDVETKGKEGEKKEEHKCDHDHGHEGKKKRTNINVDAAFLHALGDMIMSIGVCIAAVIIFFWPDDGKIADPICTFVFSVIVCCTVRPIIKNCVVILMEGSPDEINSEDLLNDMRKLEEGIEIHDFHLWSISVGKFALSAHIRSKNPQKFLRDVTGLCNAEPYNLDHTTF